MMVILILAPMAPNKKADPFRLIAPRANHTLRTELQRFRIRGVATIAKGVVHPTARRHATTNRYATHVAEESSAKMVALSAIKTALRASMPAHPLPIG